MNRGYLIKMLIKLGYPIEFKETVRKNGYTVFYVNKIGNQTFRCCDQTQANRELEKIIKEFLGEEDNGEDEDI